MLSGDGGDPYSQQLAAPSQVGLPVAVGEKAVVADALKTVRQNME